jgi:hypothetical protein
LTWIASCSDEVWPANERARSRARRAFVMSRCCLGREELLKQRPISASAGKNRNDGAQELRHAGETTAVYVPRIQNLLRFPLRPRRERRAEPKSYSLSRRNAAIVLP